MFNYQFKVKQPSFEMSYHLGANDLNEPDVIQRDQPLGSDFHRPLYLKSPKFDC